jgi:hypothetical protein
MLKNGRQRTREEPLAANTNLFVPDAPARRDRWRPRLARLTEPYCYWLTGQPMSQQDWTTWEIRRTEAFLRSVTNGLVRHLDGLVSECPCCMI